MKESRRREEKRFRLACAGRLVALLSFSEFGSAQRLQNGGTSCRLATFIPFTDVRHGAPDDHANNESYGYGSWPSAEVLGKASFSLLASAEIARRHFNERNTSIVKELDSLVGSCPITIPDTSFYVNSAFSRNEVVGSLLAHEFENVKSGLDPATQLCAIIGPVETESHEGLSPIAENFHIPQIAYESIQHRLSRKDLFPMFTRVVPDATDWGETLAKAVHRDLWLREYLAIVYEPDYGDQFEGPLEDAEDELDNFFTITEEVHEGSDESIRDALGEVISEGYRTIMYIGNRFTVLDDVARVADEMGLLGEGFFWIISGDAIPPKMLQTVKSPVGSALDKLLNGAALFTNYDPFVYQPRNDPFLNAWREQSGAFTELLNSRVPQSPGGARYYEASPSYFQEENPTEFSSFIYDAVMAAGIGACQAQSQQSTAEPDDAHYRAILKTSFTGASGPLKFKQSDDGYENSRDMNDLRFGLHNLRPLREDRSGNRGYEAVLYAIWAGGNEFIDRDGEVEHGAWKVVSGGEFFFFSGTTTEPSPLRDVTNANYLSRSTQITGFVLVSLSCFLSLCSAGWVFLFRQDPLVRASQPPFLYLLCLGSILVSISLVFISFDEDKGWSQTQLDRGCSAFPWVFILGYETIYCALLMKLYRISQLMQFRRKVVHVSQVLAPFGALLLLTIAVLTVWQILDPLLWVREITNRDPLETYGECQVGGSLLAFLPPLGCVIVVVTASTAGYAWKLRAVQSDLAESKWIFFGIFTHLQLWAVGIPIVVITDDTSRDAGYMMFASLSFVFSTTMVAFVIWPKIFVWFRNTFLGGAKKSNIVISTSGKDTTRISGMFDYEEPSRVDRSSRRPHSASCDSNESIEDLLAQRKRLEEQLKESTSSRKSSAGPDSPDALTLVREETNLATDEGEDEEEAFQQELCDM